MTTTYGQISPRPGCSRLYDSNPIGRPRTPDFPEIPGQVLSNNDVESTQTNLKEKLSEVSIASVMSITFAESDDDDNKNEKGIQAGSPLGEIKRKTKTTLTCSAQVSAPVPKLLKDPWKPSSTTTLDQCTKPTKVLAPLKNEKEKKIDQHLQTCGTPPV